MVQYEMRQLREKLIWWRNIMNMFWNLVHLFDSYPASFPKRPYMVHDF